MNTRKAIFILACLLVFFKAIPILGEGQTNTEVHVQVHRAIQSQAGGEQQRVRARLATTDADSSGLEHQSTQGVPRPDHGISITTNTPSPTTTGGNS